MHSERDEQEELKLDEIFKKNLALIRPHILNIKSVTDANLCRIWIERLNKSSTQERAVRNLYICELRHQVEVGNLKHPFNSPPPDGSLNQFSLNSDKDRDNITNSSWSDVSLTTVSHQPHDLKEDHFSSNEESVHISSVVDNCHEQISQLQKQYEERLADDQALINRYQQALGFCVTNQNCGNINSIEQLQKTYENKVTLLKSQIKELQKQNKNLQQDVESLKKFQEQNKTDCEWNSLYEEINNLKIKLTDVQNSKKALQESQKGIVSHYQREMGETINHLYHRLNEAQYKNRNVEMKLQVALDQLEKLFVLLRKERNVPAIEDKCEKIESGDCYDVKPKEVHLKTMATLKNEEVKHLEEVLKAECYKMQEEVNFIKGNLKVVSEKRDRKFRAKVCELQKIVDNHTRTKAKLLKIYNHKLCCVQKERHFEVKSLELQLHTQRAEIIACLSQDKHRELEMVVAKLEERYKEMLVDIERKFRKRQEEDQMRISQLEVELKNLLSQNNEG